MIGQLLSVIFGLMVVVNLITEMAKKLGLKKTNLFVIILSELLTLVSFFIYVDVTKLSIEWYYIVGAVFVGLGVAYSAMFGYDKLKQAILQITDKKEG